MNAAHEVINIESAPSTAMTLAGILRHVELVEKVIGEVMKEGTHYGASFPGDTKKNLLKPGADKLCLAFQLSPAFEVMERQLPNEHREYRITCRLTTPQGRVMGEGVGSCSTMEKKYRYRSDKRTCPECGKEAIIKGKKEYGGGWLCFQKKDGCGAKWPDGAKEIEGQVVGQVENADIADVFNTVLKIAKKRAYVDATITATAASDLFTQDIEDIGDSLQREEAKETARAPQQQAPQEERRESPKGGTVYHSESIATAQQQKPATTPKPTTTTNPTSEATTTKGVHGDTLPQRPDSITPATGKAANDIWIRYLRKAVGDRFASAVWKCTGTAANVSDHQLRFDTMRAITLACEDIKAAVGDKPGNDMIDAITGGFTWDVEGVQQIRIELVRASTGEVATAQASAGPAQAEDEPAF